MGVEDFNLNKPSEISILPLNSNLEVNRKFFLKVFALQLLRPRLYKFEKGERDKSQVGSYLDTPVFGNLKFEAGKYKTLQGEEVEYEELDLHTCLMDITLPRHTIKTGIAGRDGEIIEYVNSGSYKIHCRALLVEGPNFPEDLLTRFRAIMEAPESLEVTSELLYLFGIDKVAIDGDPNVAQIEGYRNTLAVEFHLIEDRDLELTLTDNEEA